MREVGGDGQTWPQMKQGEVEMLGEMRGGTYVAGMHYGKCIQRQKCIRFCIKDVSRIHPAVKICPDRHVI